MLPIAVVALNAREPHRPCLDQKRLRRITKAGPCEPQHDQGEGGGMNQPRRHPAKARPALMRSPDHVLGWLALLAHRTSRLIARPGRRERRLFALLCILPPVLAVGLARILFGPLSGL